MMTNLTNSKDGYSEVDRGRAAPAAKSCQSCGLVNPGTAQRCDCGYDFAEGRIKGSFLSGRRVETLPLASREQRFGAFVVDTFAIAALTLLLNLGLESLGLQEDRFLSKVLFWGTAIAYYVVWEALTQRTPGKLIVGTRVVTLDGAAPDLGAVFARSLIRLVPFEAFSGLGSAGIWWHDRHSETRVIAQPRGRSAKEIRP